MIRKTQCLVFTLWHPPAFEDFHKKNT